MIIQQNEAFSIWSQKWKRLLVKENNDNLFESIHNTITSSIQKSLGKNSCRIIDSVANHTIIISKYNSLAGSIYIKLPKELDHPKKVSLIFKILMKMNALNGIWLDP